MLTQHMFLHLKVTVANVGVIIVLMIGRAETNLKLADKAIRDGFDGKAVDLVAMTLYDLTMLA